MSQLVRVASCHSSRSKVEALFTSTPIGPSAAVAAGINAATSASRARSARSATARRPRAVISAIVACASSALVA